MARKPKGRDHTISPYTVSGYGGIPDQHVADCSCGWSATSGDRDRLLAIIAGHRDGHRAAGDHVEVV